MKGARVGLAVGRPGSHDGGAASRSKPPLHSRRVSSRRPVVLACLLALGSLVGAGAAAQNPRPAPGRVVPPSVFTEAVSAGTRAPDGRPGAGMWTNRANYRLGATLNPDLGRIEGRVRILYLNRSPDTLDQLVLHLHQNLHAPGVVRNEPQEITGGMALGGVSVASREVPNAEPGIGAQPGTLAGSGASGDSGAADGSSYRVEGTLMTVDLETPVQPGDSVEIEVEWVNVLPQNGAGRMGHSLREVYFVAYWFPRMAVYDDLRGWDAEPYLGRAEFYHGFGDYEAELTVPVGWTLTATGELSNPEEVFTDRTRARLAAASLADTLVTVATVEELAAGGVTTEGVSGLLTYRFQASGVRDFTWSASRAQQWDATSARVTREGVEARVAIQSFWRPARAPVWRDQWRFAKHAIEFHSRFTEVPYPWPHMTSVEGADIIGGGMEFPMLTLIGPYLDREAEALYNVTSHELAHMWVPMLVGTNEKRHAWMDEGLTTYLENQSRYEYWPGSDAHVTEREAYLATARSGAEEPLMRHGDYYSTSLAYGTASYAKAATLFVTLRDLLGEDVYLRAYRSFLGDWISLHPTPWDLFNTFEREAGEELDWFWMSYFYETWTVDPAITAVESSDDATVIRLENGGFGPMPLRAQIQFESGNVVEREIEVDAWLAGDGVVELRIPRASGRVVRVQLDPREWVPDLDRSNNVWPALASGGP